MNPTSIPPVHFFRGILRHLRRTTNDTNMNDPLKARPTSVYVKGLYRAARSLESREKAEGLRLMASEYFTLQCSLAERSKLHLLDAGAEMQLSPKELSKRAAARAGLKLPKLHEHF